MDLSIIIVNWNSKEYLRKCLASVLTSIQNISFEIIVIDGASFDGCGDMLLREYPSVIFIQSQQNVGFARANNEAVKSAKGDVLLFLNPDTEVERDAIETLFHALKTLPQAGIVGAKLLNSDRSLQTSCVQAFPTILNQALNIDLLRNRFPGASLWGNKAVFEEEKNASSVDALSGACLMVSQRMFIDIGSFSADYFMYSDDVHLCYNSRKAGLKNYYVPSAVILHHGGGSSRQKVSTFASVLILESRWRYFLNTKSRIYGVAYRGIMLLLSIIRLAVAIGLGLSGAKGSREIHSKKMWSEWKARFRWALGLERWVKDF